MVDEKQQKPNETQRPRAAQKTTWKGKEWYELVAPKLFGEHVLAETPSSDVAQLKGRTVVVNAAALTGNPAKYYFKLRFRVASVSGRRALCEYAGHECSRDFISRMVRRRSKRIDTRDVVNTKDGRRLTVKVVAATAHSTKTSIQSEVKKKISAAVSSLASQTTLDDWIREMLSGDLQKALRSEASKVYPLRELEINKTEVMA